MFQIEVDREKALVLLRIVQRHAFGNQMIVFNLDHGPGHRVGHLRKIHRRGEIAHGDLPGKVRLLTAAAQGDIDIGIAAAYLTAEATAQGLSTCIIGWLDDAKLRAACGLNQPVRLVIALGYAKEGDPLREKKRRDMGELVDYR